MASAQKLLGTYLNDHLAGSIAGEALARRIAKRNAENEYGRETTGVAMEIGQDQEELRRIMDRLGIRQKRFRLGVAWVVEKVTRLKPSGQLVGYSPLSRVLELEGLVMGITGKLELWRALQELEEANPALERAKIEQLIQRAESQRERVEHLRVKAAAEAMR